MFMELIIQQRAEWANVNKKECIGRIAFVNNWSLEQLQKNMYPTPNTFLREKNKK